MLKNVFVACALLCASLLQAEARPRHAGAGGCVETGDVMRPVCGHAVRAPSGNFLQGVRSIRVTMHRVRSSSYGASSRQRHTRVTYRRAQRLAEAPSQAPSQVIVGGRPAGCPHAFCGCGASLHLFGRIIPSLNLAANWLRFPRAAPAPKMAAARRGHVFVLEQHIAGDVWLVYDANSGGHLTRLHARSIAGYAVVNPGAASWPSPGGAG